MKLGTLKNDTRDGALCVVARDLKTATVAYDVAPTLQAALDDWDFCAPRLQTLYEQANSNPQGSRWFEVDFAKLAAPLPRGHQWLDAVGYLSHVERMYKAFGTELPKTLREEPLMYQGASDAFLGPRDDIAVEREDWEIDLEGELAVVLGDVPMGVKREKAGEHIRLLMLANDVSLRALVPAELAKGCGFVHSKTWTAFSPVAATPDEFGDVWDGRKLRLPLVVHVNDKLLGRSAPARSSARAPSRTATPRSGSAASPRRGHSSRPAAKRRRRHTSDSAIASNSRCATPKAARSSARSSSG
jgi:fumarylacetoacetate (FAA) hydrolase